MDIMTGLIIWAAQAVTLGVLLLARWVHDRSQTFFLSWSIGFGLFGTGLILVGLRGQIPTFISIEIANTMALASTGLLIAGMQQFDGKRVDPYIAIPALIWVGGMLLPFVREDFAARVVLYHVAASIGFLMLLTLLLRHDGRSKWARRILASIFGVHITASLLTAASTALSAATSFSNVPSPSLMLLPGAFCFLALVMTGAQMLTDRSEQKLKDLALTDPLTGVLNRRGLIDDFHRLKQADRPGKPMIALLQFDLDNFKQINDRCGHQAGDSVLVAFSRLAALSFRGRGSFGRMGGEEFASIIRVADLVEAASIAEGLRMTLALQTINAGGQQIAVTASSGIALQPAATANLDTLLSAADRALYTAKNSGRNCSAVDRNGVAHIVPSATMLSQGQMTLELQADEQVTALRRVTAIGST
jgi:diguanylate cyclase (GGDEF)-like protein